MRVFSDICGSLRRLGRKSFPGRKDVFPSLVPFYERDISEQNQNMGRWRLMETPLIFLVYNRALVHEDGTFVRFDEVFDDIVESEVLYADNPANEKIQHLFSCPRNFATILKDFPAVREEYGLRLTDAQLDALVQFANASLVPKSEHPWDCRIDRERLVPLLEKQLGDKCGEDPFVTFANFAEASFTEMKFGGIRYKAARLDGGWRLALAKALFLFGHSERTKKDAMRIFDAMNLSLAGRSAITPEMVDTNLASKFTIDWRTDAVFDADVMKHANYANSFFMALFAFAKRRGVVPTSLFGWVRALDRTLWYSLSQVGRRVGISEAAGPWSQYMAENVAEITAPCVIFAVEAFEKAMNGYCKKGE